MTKERLLIIEDETSVAKQLKWSLSQAYDISIAADAKKARQLLTSGAYPVATLDLGLPPSPDTPHEGLKLLEDLGTFAPHTKVIVITGNSEQETAVKAVASGAVDFCAKPIDLKVLEIILSRTFRLYTLEEANRRLRTQIDQGGSLCGIIGVSPVMHKVFSLIRKVSETDYPVLATGESGTGKEMVAHAIHTLSARCHKPFVIINCGAIPENLLESELFGHEKGAFTGAVARKTGKFEQADSGTVFLDEIGDLPLAMQVKILRFLQEGTVERVGGKGVLKLDVRIIAATNINLKKAISRGDFREDLYFRMNVVPVHLPLLKERPEDIMVLAQHFLRTETQSLKAGRVLFSPGAIAALSVHDWPGNVRELHNRIRRSLSIFTGQTITPDNLGLGACQPDQTAETFSTLQEARNQAEQDCIRKALLLTGNNISQAAKLLKTSRPTLHDLLKKHNIKS
ncbi:MAG: PEP-CTERM-box response regulator transcription factor [Desulfobacteraceae bacterium]|nr:PEP-CTERM-box response regulator transcription factor [Desulfobacteraceae bacterium]MBC2754786.1 PEP-CTERM-box response regulator transcription factor [Desulfobacteraceae bacterium]